MEKGIVTDSNLMTLSSGEKTHYYYNLKSIMADPEGISLIAELMLEKVRELGAKSVGGLEVAAIPLSTAIIMKAYQFEGMIIKGFYVRKQPKQHGLKKQIEGYPITPVVIVDDVLTTGESVSKAMDSVRQAGFNVAGVVCIVDRQEDNILKQNNVKYTSLFTHYDFKSFIDKEIEEKKKQDTQQLH